MLRYDAKPFALRSSGQNESLVRNRTDSFLCCPSISPLHTRLLDVHDGYRVCILPNIRLKNRRDIDGTLGMSTLRFEDIALCVAKPLENFVVECRHRRKNRAAILYNCGGNVRNAGSVIAGTKYRAKEDC